MVHFFLEIMVENDLISSSERFTYWVETKDFSICTYSLPSQTL
jgi:hypothetical protein